MGNQMSVVSRIHSAAFAQIEYAHVVAYFRRDLTNPIQLTQCVTERLEDVPGEGEFALVIHSDVEVHEEGASLKPLMDNFRRLSDGEQVKRVLVTRQRRDAEAKFVDYLWLVEYMAEEVYEVAQDDCRMVSTVRLNGFLPDVAKVNHDEDLKMFMSESSRGREASRDLLDDIVRLMCGCPELYYLLVDIAPMEETGADGIYHPESHPHVSPRSPARDIEAKKWTRLREKRRDFVRGVFWGNYLGPEMLERLGGKESFRRRYIEKAKQEVLNWRSLVQDTPHGGLFVKISRDPLDEVDGRIGGELAVWLHDEFRRIGALL